MIEHFRDAAQLPERPDVVVVGAGAVGIPLAVHLARGGKRVLLLEAGGPRRMDDEPVRFDTAVSTGHLLKGLHDARFRALGGTTNAWGGQLLEFDRIIFEERPWVPDGAWPFGREELEPFYERAFELLGMGHRIRHDENVWRRLGVVPPHTGDDIAFFFTRWTPQPNFARAFRADLTKNPNLHVLTNAPVVGLWSAEDGRRIGVIVAGPDKATHALSAEKIVLAQGTVETARLLMMPLVDRKVAPWTGNPWLGRGFCDHVDANVGRVTPINPARFHRLFDGAVIDGLKYLPKLKLTAEAQRKHKLLGIAAHFVFDSRNEEGLKAIKGLVRGLMQRRLEAAAVQDWHSLAAATRVAVPAALHLLLRRRIYNPGDRSILLRVTGEQMPLRESGLRLTDQVDAVGMPLAEIDWRIDGEAELKTIAEFSSRVAQFLATEGLARVDMDPRLDRRDPAFMAEVEDGYHQMGMARMGHSPGDGVVDADQRVFGTENLFVAGAATFRSAGFPNPTLTAIAAGLRLGDTILRTTAVQKLIA